MDALISALERTQILAMLGILILLFVWESFHPFYEYFVGSGKDRGKHVVRNLAMGILNALLGAVVFAGLWLAVSVWADEARFGLLHWLQDSLALPPWAHTIGAVLLFDAWMYAWHRLNHVIPFF